MIKDRNSRTRILYLMAFSFIIDILWLLIWGSFWNNKKYYPAGYWENTIHTFVLILSFVGLCIKVSLFR